MNILEKIAARTRERVEEQLLKQPLEELRRKAESMPREANVADHISAQTVTAKNRPAEKIPAAYPLPFEKALSGPDISFICEVKRASPSRGMIASDFPYLDIAREYEAAGAAAISCLTEPYWFLGSDRYLQEIAGAVSIPVLRKDFTVHESMIYEAKILGASAVLLICAILEDGELKAYGQLAEELGMSALVEAHSAKELERALKAGARIVGVNNRDLKTFQVDLEVSRELRSLAPPEILFVSESGIRDAADIQRLKENGTNAVLVGETLMRAPDKRAALEALKGAEGR